MPLSYEPLFSLLLRNNIMLKDIQEETGLSKGTIAKFRKGEPVHLETLVAIIKFFRKKEINCDFSTLVTYVPDRK